MMIQSIRRAGFLAKNQLRGVSKLCNGLGSIAENVVSESPSGMGFATFSSKAMQNSAVPTQRAILNSSFVRHFSSDLSHTPKVMHEASGLPVRFKVASALQRLMKLQSSFRPAQMYGMHSKSASYARSFSSKASESTNRRRSEAKKEISTIEDPFDPLTYNIPQKPVTFTEGASYSIIILAGLGVAAAAAYGVFKELIFQPKEYKIYGKALDRIQNDGQVRVRIGAPITGYGSESKNRAARQRIPNRTWTDEDGVEHIEVNFYIRGPHGAGKVYTEMFKDKEDKQWKFTYLIVDINSPSQVQLMLESYVPA